LSIPSGERFARNRWQEVILNS